MLLYDIIQQYHPEVTQRITAMIGASTPKYDVSNIAEYFFNHTKETWSLDDLKYAVPPLDAAWIEYKLPPIAMIDGKREHKVTNGYRAYYGAIMLKGKPPVNQYLFAGQFWAVDGRGAECKFSSVMRFSITDAFTITDLSLWDSITQEIHHEQKGYAYYTNYVLLLAFSFANTKNIETVAIKAPHVLNCARVKRGKQPLVSYKVINVLPFGKVHSQQSRSLVSTGDGVALHIRAGHFARYGPKYNKGLLFGKHEGMYWIPQSLIGSPENGVSVHDYKAAKV